MSTVGFFTPISFQGQTTAYESFLEGVDDYCHLWGDKAQLIRGRMEGELEATVLATVETSCLLTALKIASYFTVIIPLIMLALKAALRCTHHFHLIPTDVIQAEGAERRRQEDLTQQLEAGVEVSQETMDAITRLSPYMFYETHPEVRAFNHMWNGGFFALESEPNLIFWTCNPSIYHPAETAGPNSRNRGLAELHFEKMKKALSIVTEQNLDLLAVPHAKIFYADGKTSVSNQMETLTFIAIQCKNVDPRLDVQEEYYQTLPGLDPLEEQLATFYAQVGAEEVSWRMIPISSKLSASGNRQAVLLGLDKLPGDELLWNNNSKQAIGGNNTCRGLIGCLASADKIARVRGVATQREIFFPDCLVEKRLEEIEVYHRLQQWYQDKGLAENPQRSIQVEDFTSLGFSSEELSATGLIRTEESQGSRVESKRNRPISESITLREVMQRVIAEINSNITTSTAGTTKGIRNMCLDAWMSRNRLAPYVYLPFDPDTSLRNLNADQVGSLWIARTLRGLLNAGHIFSFSQPTLSTFWVQA